MFYFAVEILGMLIACIGCYNLFKMNPTTFIDAALGYTFYRLCIVSSQLRRRGFSNDLIIRVKFSQLTLHPQSDSAVSYFLKANSFGIANGASRWFFFPLQSSWWLWLSMISTTAFIGLMLSGMNVWSTHSQCVIFFNFSHIDPN